MDASMRPFALSPFARLSLSVALALVPIAACGGSKPADSPSRRVTCATDADCEITDFAGCCPCCPTAAYASPRANLAARRRACAADRERSACKPCDEGITCKPPSGPPASQLVARCRDGACVAG
jgi:hypothetical protein